MSTRRKNSPPMVVLFFVSFVALVQFAGCQQLAGFKAKALCSNIFNSQREATAIERDELTMLLGFQNAMPTTISYDERKVETIFWFSKAVAVYRDGLGATLLHDMTEAELMDQDVPDLTPFPPGQELQPWPTGDLIDYEVPSEVDTARLSEALDFAFEEPVYGEHHRRTRGVVVVYNGLLIAERYATEDDFFQDTRQVGWSMTKSVTNALVGMLARQGALDPYAPAPVPEWSDPADPRNSITLDELLRMSSGLHFNEELDILSLVYGTDDSGAFAAENVLIAAPGSRWSYSSGTSNIIARIIKHTFDNPADHFAFPRRMLFDKLGMRSALIEPDGSGTFIGSSYMWASPRDWARFGLLYLNDGVWEGERLLPEGWVDYTTTPTPPSNGLYGAHFWLNTGGSTYPELPEDLYECRGWLGQRVNIIPSRNLVVVRLGYNPNINLGSENYLDSEYWTKAYHEAFVLKIIESIDL